ncbi:helix-turn-helix domain-containing protein [Pseudovibrio brasiliensis]|uniref:HTH cro/C1-type domain-containing protein n=1 Tax=Pseudovibrio brasiliensis TaxID=1898042 RepID=A0ABX8ALJ3_9HYPH|nr:hypothetical protein [Pseudovibrio brasiliensis]QUS54516.1 hypothetical protein KGB56_14060 [Pseudovibrio brasiliensis]
MNVHSFTTDTRRPMLPPMAKKGNQGMNPNEFKAAREKLDLSAAELGRILNTDPRTVRRWEDASGTRPPNPIACRVLEWMLEGFRPPEFPEKPAN